jgi:hypothetical protein
MVGDMEDVKWWKMDMWKELSDEADVVKKKVMENLSSGLKSASGSWCERIP